MPISWTLTEFDQIILYSYNNNKSVIQDKKEKYVRIRCSTIITNIVITMSQCIIMFFSRDYLNSQNLEEDGDNEECAFE